MRKVLFLVVLASFCLPFSVCAQTPSRPDLLGHAPIAISQDGPFVRIYSPEVREPVRLFVISDTHLFLSDEREEPFRDYSKRMAAD